jgi:hypothetical protein
MSRGRLLGYFGCAVLLMVGCAANSGVVPTGPDTYMISRQAATGFSGMGTLKADALREAGAYCIRQHKTAQLVSASESTPPFVLGNFPKAEIEFKCI